MSNRKKKTERPERELSFDDPRTTLWVKAPEFQGYLLKKGFRWTRQWKRRYVILQNRELTYYDTKPPDDEIQRQLVEPRGSVTLQKDLKILTKSLNHSLKDRPFDFVLYPGGDELPWELRAESLKEREQWLTVFNHCVHVASWLQTFQMGGLLGVGAAAVVREVKVRATGEKYALKIVTIHDPRMRQIALQEVQVLQRVTENIKHRNLVTIKKVYESADKLLIAMPLCSGGELYERVANLKRFTEIDAACALYRVLDALRALHRADPPILHLDVKPENLLYENMDEDAELLVTDFGLARVYEGASKVMSPNHPTDQQLHKERMVGTVGYMAPEIITHRLYTPAADVFSAGVVLYTLLVGYPPFGGRTDREVLENTATGRYSMKPERGWKDVCEDAQLLVRRLIETDPSKRITLDEALSHPWLLQGKPGSDENLTAQLKHLSLNSEAVMGGGGSGGGLSPRHELPELRASQDKLRNYNNERTTLRLSRAAEFVLKAVPAKEGEEAPLAQMIPNDTMSTGGSPVINLQNPVLRKKLERAFWLLAPFNQGKLSQNRFELLARVVKASHWPQKPLFQFFDRDNDGLVSIDDFFEAQAQVRIRGTDFLFLVFESYLATVPSKDGNAMSSLAEHVPVQSTGDQIFDSPVPRALRSPSKNGNTQGVPPMIRLEHVRAMFEARKVPGGVAFADAVFKAALEATGLSRGRSTNSLRNKSSTPPPSPGGGGGGGGATPVSPSTEEWNERMGDLLPSDGSLGVETNISFSSPSSSDGILFAQFRRAVAALPVLVDVMLAESKTQALSVINNKANMNSTPIVDSVIEEERGSSMIQKN